MTRECWTDLADSSLIVFVIVRTRFIYEIKNKKIARKSRKKIIKFNDYLNYTNLAVERLTGLRRSGQLVLFKKKYLA